MFIERATFDRLFKKMDPYLTNRSKISLFLLHEPVIVVYNNVDRLVIGENGGEKEWLMSGG